MPKASCITPEYLTLDEHTMLELEVFESKEGASLFRLCNLTRTKDGESVLQRRMSRPWASSCRIRETQTSLIYILENRSLFNRFCASNMRYVTGNIDTYMHAALPTVVAGNFVEFTLRCLAVLDLSHTGQLKIGKKGPIYGSLECA